MKIATYNVNGVNGRLPRLLEWLAETQPDIACLQEIKTDDTKFPAPALADAGYGAIWHGQRAHHGVAILARGAPPTEIGAGFRVTRPTRRRATSRHAAASSRSHRSTCPTAIRNRDPSSTTSSRGSSD